jgi:general secretion pathway protein A
MYSEYFGLKELPFSIAPDPRYLYMSEKHREALAHLVFGVNSENGFVLLTGEVGTGKTTVCRCLLEQMPENTDIAFILNPKVTAEELLATICDELAIGYPEGNTSIKVFVDLINGYLLDSHAKGRSTVLIIEEAQNLSPDVLEQIRLLTNLETNQRKLIRIIMVGQPELKDMLSVPALRQLAQRITARYHLTALSRDEVTAYVSHRLAVAGGNVFLFPDSSINKLYGFSRGIPRLINLLCDRALLGAYVQGKESVDKKTMTRAAQEVFGEQKEQVWYSGRTVWSYVGLIVMICGILLAVTYYNYNSEKVLAVKKNVLQNQKKDNLSEVTVQRVQPAPLQWPEGSPISRSKDLAYEALFDKWKVPYITDKSLSACEQARINGLQCLEGKAGLNNLREMNRPAILEMFDEQGSRFFVTLIGLDAETATFEIGAGTMMVSVNDVAVHWLGEYILLWRVPPGYRSYIKRGSEGKAVQWVDKLLARHKGLPAGTGIRKVFDMGLEKQVREFQISRGLVPDGIVGPLTVIHLNNSLLFLMP